MLRVKRIQRDASRALDFLHESLTESSRISDRDLGNPPRSTPARSPRSTKSAASTPKRSASSASAWPNWKTTTGATTHLSQQLYDEALECRMRPFVDATGGFARMVRDVARSLDKQVRFVIAGEATEVDRDILDLLEAPLGHLLRNAVDHGIEAPSMRRALGKPPEGTITLEARHSAGSLFISVSDDGGGIDLDALRRAIVQKRLANEDHGRAPFGRRTARIPVPARLLDARHRHRRLRPRRRPGRGAGRRAAGARQRCASRRKRCVGTRFVMQLPLTLSVIRSLIVEVDGEPYGLPLAHVTRTLVLPRASIDLLEGHQHFAFEGRRLGLVTAHQILRAGTLRDRQRHAQRGRDRAGRGELRRGRRPLSRRAHAGRAAARQTPGQGAEHRGGRVDGKRRSAADRRSRRLAARGRKAGRRRRARRVSRRARRAWSPRRESACWWSTTR